MSVRLAEHISWLVFKRDWVPSSCLMAARWPQVTVLARDQCEVLFSSLLYSLSSSLQSNSFSPLCAAVCALHSVRTLSSPLCLSVSLFASPQEKEGGHPAQPGGPALLHHRRGPGEDPSAQVHHSEFTKQHLGLRIGLMVHSVRIY